MCMTRARVRCPLARAVFAPGECSLSTVSPSYAGSKDFYASHTVYGNQAAHAVRACYTVFDL